MSAPVSATAKDAPMSGLLPGLREARKFMHLPNFDEILVERIHELERAQVNAAESPSAMLLKAAEGFHVTASGEIGKASPAAPQINADAVPQAHVAGETGRPAESAPNNAGAEPIRICICPNCGLRHGFAEPASSVPMTEKQIHEYFTRDYGESLSDSDVKIRDLALAGLRAGNP